MPKTKYSKKEIAIMFASYITDRTYFSDFVFMSDEMQSKIYDEFLKTL